MFRSDCALVSIVTLHKGTLCFEQACHLCVLGLIGSAAMLMIRSVLQDLDLHMFDCLQEEPDTHSPGATAAKAMQAVVHKGGSHVLNHCCCACSSPWLAAFKGCGLHFS